jgi:hypothetical protein
MTTPTLSTRESRKRELVELIRLAKNSAAEETAVAGKHKTRRTVRRPADIDDGALRHVQYLHDEAA